MLVYKPKDHHVDKTPPHNARKLVFSGEVKCESFQKNNNYEFQGKKKLSLNNFIPYLR